MPICNKHIKIQYKQKTLEFNYSYNDYTKYQDLLEHVYSLYPNMNLCSCYIFANKNNYINSDTLLKESGAINEILYIKKMNNICQCDKNITNLYTKTKREIIELLYNNVNVNNKIEVNNQNQTIEYLKKKNDSLKEQLNNLQNNNDKITKEKEEKEMQIISLKKKQKEAIDKLEKEKNSLELALNLDLKSIDKLNQLGVELKYKGQNNIIKIDPETHQIKGRNENLKVDFNDFYDVIIDIKSIKDINKGWAIKMNEKGLQNYEQFHKDKIIKIGVIGNSNKGKSFLLSKISKIKLPSGTSIRTEGLSVKYPELDIFEDRKIALLDSAGLETPVLKSPDDAEANKKISEKELFKEKSREKLITELFLQNYIINVSDILIIVVGILTYSEQKLLNRIKTEIQRAKIKKPLFIIHNLITYTSIIQVEEYIKQYLLESATFDLEKGHGINTKTKTEKESGIYYFEKNSEPKIYHLIFANADSEAGDYFNKYTLDFLEKSFIQVTDLKPFDVIQSIKERFVVLSKEIIEYKGKEKEKEITINDFCKNENFNLIKLNNEREITLKKCLIDELGFSNLKGNEFEPTCSYYKFNDNGQDKLEIRVESPGNSTITPQIDFAGEYTIIKLNGKKNPDKFPKIEDNIRNTREFGEFHLEIPLKTEDYLIKNNKPKIVDKKGLLIIQYLLEKKMETNEEFKVEDEV